MKPLMVALLTAIIGYTGAYACTPDDFVISGLAARSAGGFAIITGQVMNTCSEPMAIEMETTLYGEGDIVLDTETQWPANVTNIPPNTARAFKVMFPHRKGIKKYRVIPVRTNKW